MKAFFTCVLSFSALCGCATVPAGHCGVVWGPGGVRSTPLSEGASFVGPWNEVALYDLRGQEHNEDLEAPSSDGAQVQANASIVVYHLAPDEVVALHREVGPAYYRVVIEPILQSVVRQVTGRYPARELNGSQNVARIEQEITLQAAPMLRPFHVILETVDLRRLMVVSEALSQGVIQTASWEQRALGIPQQLALAEAQQAKTLEEARAMAQAQAKVAPTLSSSTLTELRNRAWATLASSPSSTVEMTNTEVPLSAEVEP